MPFVKFKTYYFSFAENFVNHKSVLNFLSRFSISIDRTICFPTFVLLILVTLINNQTLSQPFTSLISLSLDYSVCGMYFVRVLYVLGICLWRIEVHRD